MLRNSRMDHLLIPPSWGLFQLLKQIYISQISLFLSPWALQALGHPAPCKGGKTLSQLKRAPISAGGQLPPPACRLLAFLIPWTKQKKCFLWERSTWLYSLPASAGTLYHGFTVPLTAEGMYYTHSALRGMVLQPQVGTWEVLPAVLQV